MKKSKASNELAQLKSEDPLPLRRAKITQEAALRKVGKQRLAVEAQENALLGELSAAQLKVDAAKAKGGDNAPGLLWWMQVRSLDRSHRCRVLALRLRHGRTTRSDKCSRPTRVCRRQSKSLVRSSQRDCSVLSHIDFFVLHQITRSRLRTSRCE